MVGSTSIRTGVTNPIESACKDSWISSLQVLKMAVSWWSRNLIECLKHSPRIPSLDLCVVRSPFMLCCRHWRKSPPYGSFVAGQDYVKMTDRDIPELWANGAYKLCLEPGDLAMWDSRTTHCNHPATKTLTKIMNNNKESIQLRRLVGYICLTPTKFAEDKERLIKRRVQVREILEGELWFIYLFFIFIHHLICRLIKRRRRALTGHTSSIPLLCLTNPSSLLSSTNDNASCS